MLGTGNTEHWRDELRYCATRRSVRLGAFALVAAVAALLVVVIVQWWPAYRVHRNTMAALAAVRDGTRSALQAARIREAYDASLAAVEAWEAKLHGTATRTEAVDMIARLARRHDVGVAAQSVRDEAQPAGVTALHRELVLEGAYGNVKGFLAGLEGLEGWTTLREAQLEPAGVDGATVRARLRLMTYLAREDQS